MKILTDARAVLISFTTLVLPVFAHSADLPPFITMTEVEQQAIEALARDMPVEDLVGQLLVVGPPGDARNYRGRAELRSLVQELKVGNLFMSSYHYPLKRSGPGQEEFDRTTYNEIRTFNYYLREMYLAGSMLPPIIFADHEGPGLGSLKHQPILQPPPSLTLAATGDSDLVREAGQFAGLQLRNLGFDAMLGPVLDIDATIQGSNNQLIGNRAFGSSPEVVYGAASNYLFGLRAAGMLPFAKHFPGHGSVKGRPHDDKEYPRFYGDSENLKTNLEPFRSLGQHTAGLVSAHVTMAHFLPNQLATFSPKVIHDLVRGTDDVEFRGQTIPALGLERSVVITDDLSDMGAIRKFRLDNSVSYAEASVRALDAGHDLLLFAHLETERRQRGEFGEFGLDELRSVVSHLQESAKTNPNFERRLRESLVRVLMLKHKMLSIWTEGRPAALESWTLPKQFTGDPNGLDAVESEFSSGKDLVLQIMTASYLEVLPAQERFAVGPGEKITVFCSDKLASYYEVDNPNIRIRPIPIEWPEDEAAKAEAWDATKTDLSKAALDSDTKVLFVFSEPIDHSNLLEHVVVVTSGKPELKADFAISVHMSPTALPQAVLDGFYVVGNFTEHPLSFGLDHDLLRGVARPRTYDWLPVHIGPRGEVARPIKFLAPPESLPLLNLFSTEQERNLKRIVEERGNQLASEKELSSKQGLEIDELKAEIGRYQTTVGKAVRISLRGLGFVLFFSGVGLFIVALKRAIDSVKVGENSHWANILIRVALAMIKESIKRTAAALSGIALATIGIALFFEVDSGRAYRAVQSKINESIASIESPAPTVGEPDVDSQENEITEITD